MHRMGQDIDRHVVYVRPIVWTAMIFHVETDVATRHHAPPQSTIEFLQSVLEDRLAVRFRDHSQIRRQLRQFVNKMHGVTKMTATSQT